MTAVEHPQADTGPRPWAFADHNRVTLGERAAGGAILVLPTGAIEQHGPHLPVWTDSLISQTLAERAAARLRPEVDVIVAPPLAFGSSDHHLPFGATLSLSTTTLLAALMDLGRSAITSGFQRVYLLNGHGGNDEVIQLAARDLARTCPAHVACGSWWTIAGPGLAAADRVPDHIRLPGHAGAFETAVVQALRPDLVGTADPSPASPAPHPTRGRLELHGSWVRANGYTDTPGALTADDGAAIIDVAVAAVVDELRAFDRATAAVDLPQKGTAVV